MSHAATPRPRTETPRPYEQWPPWVALGGAGAVVLGSLMPWATVDATLGGRDVAGTEGDGVLTLILGLGFIGLYLGKKTWLAVVAALVAIGVLFIATWDMVNVQTEINDVPAEIEAFSHVSIGIGLWFVGLGGGGMLIGLIGRHRAGLATLLPSTARGGGHDDAGDDEEWDDDEWDDDRGPEGSSTRTMQWPGDSRP